MKHRNKKCSLQILIIIKVRYKVKLENEFLFLSIISISSDNISNSPNQIFCWRTYFCCPLFTLKIFIFTIIKDVMTTDFHNNKSYL